MGCIINTIVNFCLNWSFFLYFQDKLTDIKDEWSKIKGTLEYNILNSLCQNKTTGYCDCKECTEDETVNLPSECPDLTSKCNRYSKTTGIMYLLRYSYHNVWLFREMDNWKWNRNGYQNKTEYEICMKQPWKKPCVTCKAVSTYTSMYYSYCGKIWKNILPTSLDFKPFTKMSKSNEL